MSKKLIAIITAAGSGKRMNSNIRKPFIKISGIPIIIYTIRKFLITNLFSRIILTINPKDKDIAKKVIYEEYKISRNVLTIIDGDSTRQLSVYKGLMNCTEDTYLVAIHDGVRPFVKRGEIIESVNMAIKKGAVIIGEPVKNTIKFVDNNTIESTVERKKLWVIYTPQVFYYDLICKVYKWAFNNNIKVNDDAELVEKYGKKVYIIRGSSENIKITEPFDLKIAEMILKIKQERGRNV